MGFKSGIRTFSLFIILMVVMGCFAQISFALEAKVIKTANLREEMDSSSKSLSKLKAGTVVTILDSKTNPEWWRVSYKAQEGYISSDLMAIIQPPTQPAHATRNTQLREEKGNQYRVLCAIPINAQVGVLDNEDKNWWKVLYENNEGYVMANTLQMGEPPAAGKGSNDYSVKADDANASKIAKAKGINKDTVGWVNIPNTNIDDPILYGANFYYNNRNIYKNKSLEGVYPYTNRLSRNVVIFGHNLRGSNSGFHQLHHLQEAANGRSSCQYGACSRSISSLSNWYKSSDARTWNISIFGKSKWEVFAMYEVPRNEPIATLRNNWNTGPANMGRWIEGQLARSEINFGVGVSEKDQIMTIITCGTNYDSATANSRLFVFLKNVG